MTEVIFDTKNWERVLWANLASTGDIEIFGVCWQEAGDIYYRARILNTDKGTKEATKKTLVKSVQQANEMRGSLEKMHAGKKNCHVIDGVEVEKLLHFK